MKRRYLVCKLCLILPVWALSLALSVALAQENPFVVVPPPGVAFAPLSGADGSPYLGHTEGDFVVTPTAGLWFQAVSSHAYGNPVPDIFAGPINAPGVAVLQITDNAGFFTMSGLDYSSNNGNRDGSFPTTYDIQGFLGNALLYEESGTFSNSFTPFMFNALATSNSAALVDGLLIELIPGQRVTSINIDNIRVTTVPEPGALPLLACGLAGMLRWRKKLLWSRS